MSQYVVNDSTNVFRRGVAAAVEPCTDSRSAVEMDSASRTCAVIDPASQIARIALGVSCRRNQVDEVTRNGGGTLDSVNFDAGSENCRLRDRGGASLRMSLCIFVSHEFDDPRFVVFIRVANFNVHHEPIELRFRKWIGAIVIDGILRGHHHEEFWQ